MTAPPPRLAWWRRRRWQFVACTWLALPALYVSAIGPIVYCDGRGWLPESWYPAYDAAYGPFLRAIDGTILADPVLEYGEWCGRLAQRRTAPD